MITEVLVSEEVETNLLLSRTQPDSYAIALTDLIDCENGCGRALEVFAKDAPYTKWTCLECR